MWVMSASFLSHPPIFSSPIDASCDEISHIASGDMYCLQIWFYSFSKTGIRKKGVRSGSSARGTNPNMISWVLSFAFRDCYVLAQALNGDTNVPLLFILLV